MKIKLVVFDLAGTTVRDDDAVNRCLRPALEAIYSVGESQLKLFGWDRARRFVAVREEMQEAKRSLHRKLFEIPG